MTIFIRPTFLQDCDRLQYKDITTYSLICSGNYKYERDTNIRSLTIYNIPSPVLDVSHILEYYPNLEKLTITNSNISHIRGRFPLNTNLKVSVFIIWNNIFSQRKFKFSKVRVNHWLFELKCRTHILNYPNLALGFIQYQKFVSIALDNFVCLNICQN